MSKPDKRKRATIGIDIGGTKSLYALFDEGFEVLAQEKLRTHPRKGGKRAFERAHAQAVKDLMRVARRKKLKVEFAGLAVAGRVDMRAGVVVSAPNLTFLEGIPFRERLAKATGARTFVVNDVQAGLYAEHKRGAANGARHAIGVWIGTGVGGALIIDGKLHLGAAGTAGDIGNYILHPVDIGTDIKRAEVLDGIASRTAIAGDAAALAAKRWASKLRKIAGTDVRDITSGSLAKAVRKGDTAVEHLVRSRASVLGAVISNLVDFIGPDVVVLGGGLVEAMPQLIRHEVAKSIEAHSARRASKHLRIVTAKLHSHAGTVGAAMLALEMHSGHRPIELG